MGMPFARAGSKTNPRAAPTAAASNAGPADSTTSTPATSPVDLMAIERVTVALFSAASSLGGNSASTNVTSFGGVTSRFADTGALACARATRGTTTTTALTNASDSKCSGRRLIAGARNAFPPSTS